MRDICLNGHSTTEDILISPRHGALTVCLIKWTVSAVTMWEERNISDTQTCTIDQQWQCHLSTEIQTQGPRDRQTERQREGDRDRVLTLQRDKPSCTSWWARQISFRLLICTNYNMITLSHHHHNTNITVRHGSADTVVRAMNDSNGKCYFSGS